MTTKKNNSKVGEKKTKKNPEPVEAFSRHLEAAYVFPSHDDDEPVQQLQQRHRNPEANPNPIASLLYAVPKMFAQTRHAARRAGIFGAERRDSQRDQELFAGFLILRSGVGGGEIKSSAVRSRVFRSSSSSSEEIASEKCEWSSVGVNVSIRIFPKNEMLSKPSSTRWG